MYQFKGNFIGYMSVKFHVRSSNHFSYNSLYRTYLVFNVSYVTAPKPLENTNESPRHLTQALSVFHFL